MSASTAAGVAAQQVRVDAVENGAVAPDVKFPGERLFRIADAVEIAEVEGSRVFGVGPQPVMYRRSSETTRSANGELETMSGKSIRRG